MNRITLDNYEAFLLDYMEGSLSPAMVEELMTFIASHPELEIDLSDLELPVVAAEEFEYDLKSTLKKTNEPISSETLFDYLEGNLPAAEQEKVAAELLNNKTLALEFELLKKTRLQTDEQIRFENKAALRKTDDDLLFLDQTLQYFEGQLSEAEKRQFEADLKNNAALQRKLDLYAKTRLSADQTVVYPNKKELKKEGRVITLFSVRRLSAMAAAVLLLAGLFVIFRQTGAPHRNTQPGLANVVKHPQPAKSKQPLDNGRTDNTTSVVTTPSNPSNKHLLKPSLQVNPPVSGSVAPQIPSQQEEGPALAQDKKPGPSSGQDKTQNTPSLTGQERPEEPLLAQQTETLVAPSQPSLTAPMSSDEHLTKYTLLAVTEDPEEKEEGRRGFLSKAARFGKRANDIGIKVVDGNESHRRISLFNAFSVEKH